MGVIYAFHAMARKVKLNHSFVFHECSVIIEITILTYAIAWKCMYCCAQQFLIFDQAFRCMLFSFLLKEFSKLFVPWCCITEKGVCKSISVTLYIHVCGCMKETIYTFSMQNLFSNYWQMMEKLACLGPWRKSRGWNFWHNVIYQ